MSTLAVLGQRGNVPSGEARDLAARAKSVVGNLSGLLNALLDISKFDAGSRILRKPIAGEELREAIRAACAEAV